MKINIILFVLSGLVAVGIGVYVLVLISNNTKSALAPVTPDRTMTDTAFEYLSDTQPISGTDTLVNLLKIGKDIECSFVFSDSAVYSEGTGFFADGKIRVDAISRSTNGVTYVSKVVITKDKIQAWGDSGAGTYAVTMPIIATSSTSTAESEYLNIDESVSYTCRPWNVDGSIFVPPADLEFFDVGQLMNGVPKNI